MMRRRDFIAGSVSAAALVASGSSRAAQVFWPDPSVRRTFEVVTRIEVPDASPGVQVWLPLPSIDLASEWFTPLGTDWTGNADEARLGGDERHGVGMLHARWSAGAGRGSLEMTTRFSAKDRSVDPTATRSDAVLSAEQRRAYVTTQVADPAHDEIARLAARIAGASANDLDRVRAIYDWTVANTFRDPATRGCGEGDVAAMLRSGHLGGKCADINALFVSLVRAAGVPARDIYGLRAGPSRFGYKSLGANAANVTGAQHCRAEVFLDGVGWMPTDPADVRKVMLEEPPGHLERGDAKVEAARVGLFGGWEGNWLPFNSPNDLLLPGAAEPRLRFLMYPQAEVAGRRLDCLDPSTFAYSITARELPA